MRSKLCRFTPLTVPSPSDRRLSRKALNSESRMQVNLRIAGPFLTEPFRKPQIWRVTRSWRLSVAGPTPPAFLSGAGTDGCFFGN